MPPRIPNSGVRCFSVPRRRLAVLCGDENITRKLVGEGGCLDVGRSALDVGRLFCSLPLQPFNDSAGLFGA
jgi:hypothetical protein